MKSFFLLVLLAAPSSSSESIKRTTRFFLGPPDLELFLRGCFLRAILELHSVFGGDIVEYRGHLQLEGAKKSKLKFEITKLKLKTRFDWLKRRKSKGVNKIDKKIKATVVD